MEEETCEYYGRVVFLCEPWRGYDQGKIVGLAQKGYSYGYIVEVSSGAQIVCYPDEIIFA